MSGDSRRTTPGRPDDSADARGARSAARHAGAGLQFAVSIVVFLYAGQWVDRRLGSEPWGVLIGVFTGAGAAFYSLYRRLMADVRRDEREARATRETRATREARADREAQEERGGGGNRGPDESEARRK